MLLVCQVVTAGKEASQAAEQTMAATMQPTPETSIPSVPLAAANSMTPASAEKKASRAEKIFDLAVSCLPATKFTA